MKILIIGGTRFIGYQVVWQLHRHGHELLLCHKGVHVGQLPEAVRCIHDLRQHLGSHLSELEAFAPDVVVDMIALSERDAVTDIELFNGIASRLVMISSQDVYRAFGIFTGCESGPLQECPLTEESPLRTKLFMYRGLHPAYEEYEKILVEKAAMAGVGLKATILRLPMTYGPNDYQHRLYSLLKPMLDSRPYIILPAGSETLRDARGYVDNIAAAIVLTVEEEEAAGEIFNVCEEHSFSSWEWLDRIAAQVGWHGRVLTAPRTLFPDFDHLNLQQDLLTSSSKIRSMLGYREIVDAESALQRTIAWESSNPPPLTAFDPQKHYAQEDEAYLAISASDNVQ